jgi:hypothetical protein
VEKIKLRYGDKVRIKEGFYQNCFGILVGYNDYRETTDYYEVEISKVDKNNAYRTTTTRVSAEEIEKLEEVK